MLCHTGAWVLPMQPQACIVSSVLIKSSAELKPCLPQAAYSGSMSKDREQELARLCSEVVAATDLADARVKVRPMACHMQHSHAACAPLPNYMLGACGAVKGTCGCHGGYEQACHICASDSEEHKGLKGQDRGCSAAALQCRWLLVSVHARPAARMAGSPMLQQSRSRLGPLLPSLLPGLHGRACIMSTPSDTPIWLAIRADAMAPCAGHNHTRMAHPRSIRPKKAWVQVYGGTARWKKLLQMPMRHTTDVKFNEVVATLKELMQRAWTFQGDARSQ